jgi:hypothetical protein
MLNDAGIYDSRTTRSHAARNLAIASSRVAAVPFVTPRVAGHIEVMDQVHSRSGGSKREPDSRMRPTTLPSARTSKSLSDHWPSGREMEARLRVRAGHSEVARRLLVEPAGEIAQ